MSFIIVKAREFGAKVQPVEPDPGSNPSDDQSRGVLEDYAQDETEQELVDAIAGLNDEEVVDLLAIIWVGRGDIGPAEFDEARAFAFERHHPDSSSYLMGMPMLGDYLEEGVAVLGRSLVSAATEHL